MQWTETLPLLLLQCRVLEMHGREEEIGGLGILLQRSECTHGWAGRGGGGVPHRGAVPAWLFLGPGNAEHGKGVSQKDSLYEWGVPTKPLDVLFIGPR